ncbi:MAG TPA: nitrate reductase associated protein [Candidatus Binataceae bacterium]|nr:nitrate reductase associated protein [Candidatus Binataceae bacterium]
MMRRFGFEDEVHQNLGCVPMAVRRKLDRAGIKISLLQWQALGLGERLVLCHLPVESEEECEAVRIFTMEAVKAKSGESVKPLSEASRAAAEPPEHPPARLVEHARAQGITLNQPAWDKLDADERYALIKLGDTPTPSHNLAAALAEFIR